MLELMLITGKVASDIPSDTGPGPTTLVGEYKRPDGGHTGYFGTLAGGSFVLTNSLKTALGITTGTVITGAPTWLKFLIDGKIIFFPTASLMHTVSWQLLYQKGAVYGIDGPGAYPSPDGSPIPQTAILAYGGRTYRIRMMSVALTDPNSPGTINKTTEWGRLILPINQGTLASATEGGVKWAELNLSIDKTGILVKESYTSTGFITAPFTNATTTSTLNKTGSQSNIQWRPVLELIN